MRCSKCSNEVQPIVAIDIDGTLGDYHGHFLDFAEEYFDTPPDIQYQDYDGGESFRDWWCRSYDKDDKDWHDVKLAYRQGGMKRTMPIRRGATEVCRMVLISGGELWITTTRPYLSLDNIISDTVEWCRRHGIQYYGMLFDDDKYEQLARRVDTERVVAVLDDIDEMCINAAKILFYESDTPILINNHYNRAMNWQPRMDLKEAVTEVGARIQAWKEDHDNRRDG